MTRTNSKRRKATTTRRPIYNEGDYSELEDDYFDEEDFGDAFYEEDDEEY